jgi:DNA replication and repair protein RecF
MTKSAFSGTESLNIKHQAQFFLNKGNFHTDNTPHKTVQCAYKRGEKKSVRLDKKEYEKLSQHIGKFPCVLITPYDTDLVREGSEIRRKFFDNTLSQTNTGYLDTLIQHNHYLKQRNNLLKQFAERRKTDMALLETYNTFMAPLTKEIHACRKDFIEKFTPIFATYYKQISADNEPMSIDYESPMHNMDFETLLKHNLQKDLAMQRTTEGIHRDDYIFTMGNFPLKKIGSQGQQKSYVIALKLAQYNWIAQQKQITPILLLDDIFDKLDDSRIEQLLKIIEGGNFGQIFISDARPERSEKLLEKIGREVRFFHISEILNK